MLDNLLAQVPIWQELKDKDGTVIRRTYDWGPVFLSILCISFTVSFLALSFAGAFAIIWNIVAN